ncbi:hypothetical protein [Thermosipho melanesiensis]|uniref:CYTH domain-containing protein n=2 Tax=Thermosipho melanesiensis TaxID=46541 RepID=A6LL10_THEM4|nr:hypothetical protein [Thermosipho melanesiensis]ABR30611.1 hypothetical protein Tmel_0748 [Thermosipho melanesiensis BI429]APT73751.1 hypothetical protein BW47_04040 [Thermosipho melanesiensis]
MKIEREKKYILDEHLFEKLIKKSVYKVGVVQWYMDNCRFIKRENCRLRYTIDENGNEKWVVAFKSKLFGDFQRIEEEYDLEIKDISFLKYYPVVAKIRYFLMFSPAEVSIDEFIPLDFSIKVKYLAEIETDENFEKYEEIFNLKKPVEDFEEYTNFSMAKVSKLRPDEIIKKVKTMI